MSVELEVLSVSVWRVSFVSVCGEFPIDTGFYSSIGIPGCLGVQKCDGSVFFFFHRKSDM